MVEGDGIAEKLAGVEDLNADQLARVVQLDRDIGTQLDAARHI